MSSSASKSTRVAIVGASSLRGRELKLVLEERNFPAGDIVLLDEPVAAGTLTEAGGEPTFIRALDENSFEGAQFAFFAGSARDAEQNWQAAQRSGATVIDMTGALAAVGRSTSWIPSLSSLLLPRPGAGANGSHVKNPDGKHSVPYSSPGSGTIVACTLAAAFAKFSPLRLATVLYTSVSERDQAGVDELESQTTNLLSFRPIEQPIFDIQVAFNLLNGFGENAKPSLAEIRAAISRDVAHCLAGRAAVPAIQLVQVPVFYGYGFSAFADFAAPVDVPQLEATLMNLGVRIMPAGERPPSNLSVVGESEIHIGRVEPDPSVPTAVWVWGVADNLRLPAVNAVRIAEELVAEPKIQ